jgi:Ion channel
MVLIAPLLTCGLVIACVSLHYEALHLLSIMQRTERRWYSNRLRASLLVLGCLVAHGIEVVIFGFGYRFLDAITEGADLFGTAPNGFNCTYYSVVVYTSIGFGDVVPVSRAMRIMTAAEGLTGAILIAWTASFMFFHMQRFWATGSSSSEKGP